jgi:serine/threonine protein phosphatase PrpC
VIEALQGVPQSELSTRMAAARQALQQANRRLQAMAQGGAGKRTIGSTIVMMAADEKSFACLWAGDSRAYRARDGGIDQLTHDHSLVQQLVDSGDIDAKLAANHPNANIILRAVGAGPELDLDEIRGELSAGDVFLLASDGVTRLVSDDELLALLRADDLEASADRLLAMCLTRKAPDNVTFIIVRAHGD